MKAWCEHGQRWFKCGACEDARELWERKRPMGTDRLLESCAAGLTGESMSVKIEHIYGSMGKGGDFAIRLTDG